MQDGCTSLFPGGWGTFHDGCLAPFTLNRWVPNAYAILAPVLTIIAVIIILDALPLFSNLLQTYSIVQSTQISGGVPGTLCSKSTGAYAPVAPVLTEALIDMSDMEKI